jgi:ABC-2 type transport system ATP-binding protein
MNFLKTERFREYIKIIQEAYFMIEVKNLVKDYGKHHAVKDISFSVPDGQIVGLLGPNGAGKSTTMNIMTGYISATSGEVKIGGYDILEQPIQAKKLIGYLPEIPPLYEDMTVAEYLNFICDLKGIRKKTEKESSINEVTEAVKISDMKGRLIKNLSKGYKQRVGLAQALIGNPPLLILDEPTVGLDPNQIIEIRALIKSLGQKHTIILSSHILSEVNAICDYVLIIDKGTLVAEDTPEHLSEDFSDTDNINMSVKGSREQVEEVLKVSEYIRDYKIIDEKDGIVDVQAKTATKEDIRDNLFFEFAEEKLPIIKMERESLSLEDVFLKLTGQDVEEVESEAKKSSEQIEKQGHHGFSFKRKKKADSKGTEQAETAEEDK